MTRTVLLFSTAVLACAAPLYAQPTGTWDVFSDTWEAVDGLDRAVSTFETTGPPRPDRKVGMFYFLWQGEHGQTGPHDISKILAAHPEAMQDKNHPAWGPMHAMHHWGEPLFGYYLSDDRWVLRRHAQMLADAGVDVIIFDVTNQATYKKNYTAICEVFASVRADGGATPQIAFLTPFWDPKNVVNELYAELYAPGLHRELWFMWEGKPLIMADPAKVEGAAREFFTFRKPVPSYFTGPDGPDQWGWLEVFPQHVFKNSRDEAEQMTVGVAQNAVNGRLGCLSEKGAQGRSFHNGGWDTRPDAAWHGLNYAEQWGRALEVDPAFVFVTGWNEWVAMRFDEFNGVREPVMFVDQFNHENSRDIEPMRGGHGDAYYYQTVDFIRRHKGARPGPVAAGETSINLEGPFSQWDGVKPEYRDHRGDTLHRDHPGWGEAGRQVNNTGRNDIVRAKVAHDKENLYFLVETAAPVTPPTDPAWMRLYIDADGNHSTGWEGFDYVVNRVTPRENSLVLEMHQDGGIWKDAGLIPFRMEGNRMHLAIPRKLPGMDGEKRPDFRFKWADNTLPDGDPMSFTVNGDSAPPGRFAYRYRAAGAE